MTVVSPTPEEAAEEAMQLLREEDATLGLASEKWHPTRAALIAGVAALDVLVAALRDARRENETLSETNTALSRSAVANRDGRWRAERERDQARDALERIEANALAWHGPEGLDTGHARALAVIATWCRAALGGAAEGET